MIKVKMTETRLGSPDGIQVNTYESGRVYDLPTDLAEVFLRERWADEVRAGSPDDDKKPTDGSGPLPDGLREAVFNRLSAGGVPHEELDAVADQILADTNRNKRATLKAVTAYLKALKERDN